MNQQQQQEQEHQGQLCSASTSTSVSRNSTGGTAQSESCAIFSSRDFGKFLSKEFPRAANGSASNPFLSKDNPLPSFEVSTLFKSKDAFSQMFSSAGWDMKFDKETHNSESKPLQEPKTFPKTSVVETPKTPSSALLTSREWMPMNTLGSHIDVSIDQNMFAASDQVDSSEPALASTDWDNVFFSQMQLLPPSTPSTPPLSPAAEEDEAALTENHSATDTQVVPLPAPSNETKIKVTTTPVADSGRKKRKRKPRKKIVPDNKVYVEVRDVDVLLGRGGRSNHHAGNKRYREEVKNLQQWYLGIEDKDEKTDLSQCLVDYVHSYDGKFLEKDENGWYEVPNIVARRKASQALREDTDPEKRAAKRARFLKKRAQEECRKSVAATAV